MDDLKTAAEPLTESLPSGVREFLDAGGWWLIGGLAGLLVLLVFEASLRRLWRLLFRRQSPPVDVDDLIEDLANCPLPVQPTGGRRLMVYHLPVRLRLVVVAPSGTESAVDPTTVEKLLDHIVPGLSVVAQLDRPRIRVWPAQLSQHGFIHAFHRRTRRPEPEGQPSRWVLAAGRAQVGRRSLLIGLGLWADEPSPLGRVTLEPHQWLDVLRLKAAEEIV